jgi:hypothetical protein
MGNTKVGEGGGGEEGVLVEGRGGVGRKERREEVTEKAKEGARQRREDGVKGGGEGMMDRRKVGIKYYMERYPQKKAEGKKAR